MDLKTLAHALVDGCKAGKETQNLDKLYSPDAVSVEAEDFAGTGRETVGLDGIRGKHKWWHENFEVHGSDVTGPFLHGPDLFAVIFSIDATFRASGERTKMQEVALYRVDDGQIIREEFFSPG